MSDNINTLRLHRPAARFLYSYIIIVIIHNIFFFLYLSYLGKCGVLDVLFVFGIIMGCVAAVRCHTLSNTETSDIMYKTAN